MVTLSGTTSVWLSYSPKSEIIKYLEHGHFQLKTPRLDSKFHFFPVLRIPTYNNWRTLAPGASDGRSMHRRKSHIETNASVPASNYMNKTIKSKLEKIDTQPFFVKFQRGTPMPVKSDPFSAWTSNSIPPKRTKSGRAM